MITLTNFMTESGHHSYSAPCWWNFVFPCGRAANVWLSKVPFRFDMEIDPAGEDDEMVTLFDLTTDQVQERLTELASMPVAVNA